MDQEGIYAGIALILLSGISFFIWDTALPKKMQDAHERIARIWGLTPGQAKIVACSGLALMGAAIIAISIFAGRKPP